MQGCSIRRGAGGEHGQVTLLGTRLGHQPHTPAPRLITLPFSETSSRSSVHAHPHASPTSLKSTPNLFRHFLSPPQTLLWDAEQGESGCGQHVGQDRATRAASSENLVFLQPGDFCHGADTGPPGRAPPDLLPIFERP